MTYPGAERVPELLREAGKWTSEKCAERCSYAVMRTCRVYCLEARDEYMQRVK